MQVHVLYFGILKEFFDGDRDVAELHDGATVADLLEQLHDGGGAAGLPVWKSLAVAVNREYAALATELHDGDEVALLPPVSGGGSHAR